MKEELPEGKLGVVSGIVEEVKEIITKKGDKMAFIRLADFVTSIEVVAFPKTYKEFAKFLVPDACISIKGKMSKRNDVPSLLAEAVKAL